MRIILRLILGEISMAILLKMLKNRVFLAFRQYFWIQNTVQRFVLAIANHYPIALFVVSGAVSSKAN